MKMFIVGMVCGALVYGVADVWLERARDTHEPTQARLVPQVNSGPPAVQAGAAPSPLPATASRPTVAGRIEATNAFSSAELTAEGQHIFVNDDNLDSVLWKVMRRKRAIEAIRDQEPKDPLWAAATEQQLREFIARHPLGNRCTVEVVDCRTLFCDVKAQCRSGQGKDDPVPAFQKVMQDSMASLDLRQGAYGSGSSASPGMVDANMRLRRYKPGDTCPPGFQKDCWNR